MGGVLGERAVLEPELDDEQRVQGHLRAELDRPPAGNIRLISLWAPGALVVWTRHRRPPGLTPAIRS